MAAVAHAIDPLPAVTADEDPVWAAMLASPLVEDDLTDEERAGLDVGMEDIRAGREVSHDDALATVERLRAEQE